MTDIETLRARVAELEHRLSEPGCGDACTTLRRHVEAAVRATIEACAAVVDDGWPWECATMVQRISPAPIVARVLGGGGVIEEPVKVKHERDALRTRVAELERERDAAYVEQYAAQVRDLKARLKAIRKEAFSPDLHTPRRKIQDMADLRRKNWRKS